MGAIAALFGGGVSAVGAAPTQVKPKGIGGFLGNVVGDLGEIIHGFGTLAGAGVHDLMSGIAEVGTLGHAETDFVLDDMAKALPGAVAADYARRYGSGKGFLEGLYEDPLAFLGDIATVATLGGYGAARGAQVAGRAGGATHAAITAAGKAGTLDELTGSARLVNKILPGIGQGISDVRGTRNVIDSAGRVVAKPNAFNPIKRAFDEKVLDKVLTEPIGNLAIRESGLNKKLLKSLQDNGEIIFPNRPEVRRLVERIDSTELSDAERLARLQNVMKETGITRIERPIVSKFKLQRAADALFGLHGTKYIKDRTEGFEELKGIIDPLGDEGADAVHVATQITTPERSGDVMGYEDIRTGLLGEEPPIEGSLVGPGLPSASPMALPSGEAPSAYAGGAPLGTLPPAPRRGFDETEVGALRQRFGKAVMEDGRVVIGGILEAENRAREVADALGGTLIEESLTTGPYRGASVLIDKGGELVRVRLQTQRAARITDAVAKIDADIAGMDDADEIAAARRWAENLSDALVTEVSEAGGRVISPMERAVDDLRLFVHDRLTAPLIDKGMLTYRRALDRSYAAFWKVIPDEMRDNVIQRLKAEHLARFPEVEFPEPPLALGRKKRTPRKGKRQLARTDDVEPGGDTFTERQRDLLDLPPGEYPGMALDDIVRGLGRKSPVYYPQIDARRIPRRSDFLLKWGTQNMLQKAEFMGGALKKNLGGLIEVMPDGRWEAKYLTDPFDAYSRRAAQVQGYLETVDIVEDLTKQFGRRITSQDELAGNERMISLRSVKTMFQSRQKLEDRIIEHLGEGKTISVAAESALTEILPELVAQTGEDLRRLLPDLIRGRGDETDNLEAVMRAASVDSGDLWAVPKVVADRIEQFHKTRTGNNLVTLTWDTATHAWRSTVLVGSPRWVVNNLLGNIVFLKMQGGKLTDVLKQAISPKFRQMMDDLVEMAPADVRADLETAFFSGTTQFKRHPGKVADTRTGQALAAIGESKVGRGAKWYGEQVRKGNQRIEVAFRRASFKTALERQAAVKNVAKMKGSFLKSRSRLENLMKEGFSHDEAARGLDQVNYFFNDYAAGTPIERNIIRRFIAPFYPFYKHVTKLMLTYPVTHPARANVLRLLTEMSNDFGAEMGPMPEWLEGAIPIGEGDQPGDTRFVTGSGANPFNMLGDFPGSLVSALHPAAQMALERATGRDSFTGKPFTSPDVVTPFGSKQQFRYDEATGQMVPINTVTPGIIEQILQQFPQTGVARDLLALAQGDPVGARYSTGEVMTNIDGSARFPSDPLQSLGKWAGVPTTDYNLAEYQSRLSEDTLAALRAYLKQTGQLA